ncbi:MAG: YciI family protein [Candidatus Binatus sp.]
MKFLCLVYFEQEALTSLSPDEKGRLDRDSLAYDKELERRGRYIVANALQPVRTARTVRVRGGKASATDGPFAETKELLGGFILIDAANMDEAVDIAAGIPLAKLGSIEVRPIMEIGGS